MICLASDLGQEIRDDRHIIADVERHNQFLQKTNKQGSIFQITPSSQGVAGIEEVPGSEETQIKEQVALSCVLA